VNMNFTQFGGPASVAASNSSNTWTASYTIVAGTIDTTGCGVVVTATDNAGNATTTPGTANATVDDRAPTEISVSTDCSWGSVYGQTVTFTATVSAGVSETGTPTGTVTFEDGATLLGTESLSGGTTTFTTSALALGSHCVTAAYGGDSNFVGSTPYGCTQTVVDAATWSGGGSGGQWTDAANWGNLTVVADDPLRFSGSPGMTTTNGFYAGTQFNGLTFSADAGAFTLNGNLVDLAGDVTNNSTSPQTINLPLALTGGSRTINAASGEIIVGRPITENGGSYGLTKTGAGTLILTGANTYSGGTTVSQGRLVIDSSEAILSGSTIAVAVGAAVVLGDPTLPSDGNSTGGLSPGPAPGTSSSRTSGTAVVSGSGSGSVSELTAGLAAARVAPQASVASVPGSSGAIVPASTAAAGPCIAADTPLLSTPTAVAAPSIAPPAFVATTANSAKAHDAAIGAVTSGLSLVEAMGPADSRSQQQPLGPRELPKEALDAMLAAYDSEQQALVSTGQAADYPLQKDPFLQRTRGFSGNIRETPRASLSPAGAFVNRWPSLFDGPDLL
jgi:autotransporter-associated beta strand protein